MLGQLDWEAITLWQCGELSKLLGLIDRCRIVGEEEQIKQGIEVIYSSLIQEKKSEVQKMCSKDDDIIKDAIINNEDKVKQLIDAVVKHNNDRYNKYTVKINKEEKIIAVTKWLNQGRYGMVEAETSIIRLFSELDWCLNGIVDAFIETLVQFGNGGIDVIRHKAFELNNISNVGNYGIISVTAEILKGWTSDKAKHKPQRQPSHRYKVNIKIGEEDFVNTKEVAQIIDATTKYLRGALANSDVGNEPISARWGIEGALLDLGVDASKYEIKSDGLRVVDKFTAKSLRIASDCVRDITSYFGNGVEDYTSYAEFYSKQWLSGKF